MARARSLSEFQKAFLDEASCAAFLFERRWPDGFICPRCGKRRAAALKSRPRLSECLDCGRQTSITAGTAMHRSKLPLTAWFWAAHLMATHSNGMSARQLEDQLGVNYKTAWLLTQKLRRSMVDPDRELLEGVVEVDQAEIPFREGDAFFEPGDAGALPSRPEDPLTPLEEFLVDPLGAQPAQADASGRIINGPVHPIGQDGGETGRPEDPQGVVGEGLGVCQPDDL